MDTSSNGMKDGEKHGNACNMVGKACYCIRIVE